MDYARQLEAKAGQVEQTLRRVGRLAGVPMRPIIPSPLQYGYRNRIRVHVEDGRAGFFAHGSHALVDIAECPISSSEVNASLKKLRSANPADGDYTLSTRYGAAFFEQTNDAVAAELLKTVRACISPGQALLIDAYCGAGFFARHLAEAFDKVVGIEENAQAVEHARRQATERERYIAGDVAAHLGDLLTAFDPKRTTVLLDPPAIGIAPRVSDLLIGSRPLEILYVSCNPATLARDLGALCQTAYSLESVTPLDMFPQTAEIEAVARLLAN
jgi:23S rRNA (uracil1939-C5)-methyltransferase